MGRRVAALAVLLGLVFAWSPATAASNEFYGVISANDPNQTELAQMASGGVGTLRINLVWGAVQPTPASGLDWAHYDTLIGDAAREGIRVLPTVYSSPSWSARRDFYPPSRPTRGAFSAFVRAAAARYGNTGAFWTEHPELPRVPVTNWQFWNEPNLQGFWSPKLSARDYVRLLRLFGRSVHRGDPAGRIVLAGLFPGPTAQDSIIGIPLRRYLPAIYRQKHAKSLFDAVDIHPYAPTPRRALQEVRKLRLIMNRFKDRRTRIWVGELGWTTGGDPSSLTVSPALQASFLAQSYRLLAAKQRRYRIAGAIWFSWRDIPGRPWFNHTGLFSYEGDPKPAWSAFASVSGGSASLSPLPPP